MADEINPLDLKIEITTNDNMLVFDLMNTKNLQVGMTNSISPDITLRLNQQTLFESVGTPDIFTFTVSIGKDTAVGVFSAWLYDKLKGRRRKLKINGTIVNTDKNDIDRVLAEKTKQP